jgi:purine-cytosine permease-like protein
MSDRAVQWTARRTTSPSFRLRASVRAAIMLFDYLFINRSYRTLTDAALSRLSSKLIISLVYSHDIVSRLSLGSVRDLKNAAMWLCEAEARGDGQEGWSAVTARAKRWKDNTGWKEDMDWVSALIVDSFRPQRQLYLLMQNGWTWTRTRLQCNAII